MAFEDWAQEQASKLVDLAGAFYVQNPYQLQRLQLEALGPGGYYSEGKRGASEQPNSAKTIGGVNQSLLILLGIGLVAVLVIAD